MKERKSNEFWGIVILALGLVLAVKTIFGITSVILFKGWWTLFLIVPAVYSMIKNGLNKKNGIMAGVGVFLFVNCRTHILGTLFSKLFVPIILLAIGYRLLMKDHNSKQNTNY